MKISRSVAKIFFGVAAVLAAAAVIYGGFTLFFVLNAQSTVGTVVENVESDRSIRFGTEPGGGIHYRPRVEFSDAGGDTRAFTADRGTMDPAYTVGDAVTVVYSPGDPDSARIDSLWGIWGASIVLLAVALFFAACALVFRYRFDEA